MMKLVHNLVHISMIFPEKMCGFIYYLSYSKALEAHPCQSPLQETKTKISLRFGKFSRRKNTFYYKQLFVT